MQKKTSAMLFAILVAAACGGGNKPATTPEPAPTPDPTTTAEPAVAPTPEPTPAPAPPPPPAPKLFSAKVELTPIKGQKLKPVTVTLTQEEGKATQVAFAGTVEGLKPGKYHLVVHESADCGPNGTKAGKPFAATASTAITVSVTKDAPGAIETPEVQLSLDGEQSVVGKTLVLKDDKGGKPNKTQACGAIASADGAATATPSMPPKAEPATPADPSKKQPATPATPAKK